VAVDKENRGVGWLDGWMVQLGGMIDAEGKPYKLTVFIERPLEDMERALAELSRYREDYFGHGEMPEIEKLEYMSIMHVRKRVDYNA